MLEEIVVGLGIVAYVGYNFFGINEVIIRNLLEDPSRILLYEEEFKDNKDNVSGFLDYYFGYLGRHLAYRQFDKYFSKIK